MELRRIRLIQELRAACEELLNINFTTGTTNRIGVSRPFALADEWSIKWTPTFRRLYAFSHNSVFIQGAINSQLDGYDQETDAEIFNELRPILVGFIDAALSRVDQEYKVKPLLEEYTKRVKDTKLAELLKEFNATRDIAPNLVAIGFRTILCLVIQEKAKRVNPTSNTATCTDLAPREMIIFYRQMSSAL
jgi:hypothetical protein